MLAVGRNLGGEGGGGREEGEKCFFCRNCFFGFIGNSEFRSEEEMVEYSVVVKVRFAWRGEGSLFFI